MKNIVFAKIGKSIKFNNKNYSPIGGDNEASCTLRAIANRNPNITFYIIGRSDFSRLDINERKILFPYENVIDIWADVKLPKNSDLDDTYYHHTINYFHHRDIKIDYGIFMVGQIGTVTIPNRTEQVNNRSLKASVIDMTKFYSTPIIEWINRTNIPFLEIVNDPRYKLNQARDIIRPPTVSIGVHDHIYDKKHFTSFDNQDLIITKVHSTYAPVETCFCLDYERPVINEQSAKDRKLPLLIILNEGKPSRYESLNEWVLRQYNDVAVYGKWDHIETVNDKRFKGSLHISEVQRLLKTARSTFIIPTVPGCVTSKYIEMIHAGTIPFLHPTYDDKNLLQMDEFYRPKTPAELRERVELIANDDSEYIKHISALTKRYLPCGVYDGSILNQTIMSTINKEYVEPNLSSYTKKTVNSLESFF